MFSIIILQLIAASLHNVTRRDKIATAIESEGYIKKLLDLFKTCEDLENIESLHTLYEIFKNIFLLNKNNLLEVMFSEENILSVVGALEYDPAYPYPKKHREFLKSLSTFKEVSSSFQFFSELKKKKFFARHPSNFFFFTRHPSNCFQIFFFFYEASYFCQIFFFFFYEASFQFFQIFFCFFFTRHQKSCPNFCMYTDIFYLYIIYRYIYIFLMMNGSLCVVHIQIY